MTKPVGLRSTRPDHRSRCGKCGHPVPWGQACVLCGATYTASEADARLLPGASSYYDVPVPEKLRVAHGTTCSVGGEVHRCHCGGGKTHPCECYLSQGLFCHICGLCDCDCL